MNQQEIPQGYNRLYNEKSPYLRQHASNPVDWYPWGEEAFLAAQKSKKPLLVSIGYSTCHWCHVMEKESFSKPEIAAVMNEFFICVKVDREERPDIDKLYMGAVQAMTGQGGWPLNCFITPEGKPFYGGTYFPPTGQFGRTAWPDIIRGLGQAWRDPLKKKQIEEAGEKLLGAVKAMHALETDSAIELESKWIDQALKSYNKSLDRDQGGYSAAPKFPMPVNHQFLFSAWRTLKTQGKEEEALELLDGLLFTLKKMAQGGIWDQVGGGFSRYSTDERWHVPHFEKMLYDNAQLAVSYLMAWQASSDPDFLKTAEEIFRYVKRDMTSPEGSFYSAEDADSLPQELAAVHGNEESHENKTEGAFYVWEQQEIDEALGADAAWFSLMYGVEAKGNVRSDPHGEFINKNVLYRAKTLRDIKRSQAEHDKAMAKLLAIRSLRPRPHRDEKILASWNGLMISAYAKAYQLTRKEEYLQSAHKAAAFIQEKMMEKGKLYRRYSDGERLVHGNADDYAFVAAAFLDLYEADFDPKWLTQAKNLTEATQKYFYDGQDGGYFMTALGHDERLLLRLKDTQDNVEPAAASVAVRNNLRLWLLSGNENRREDAEKTLKAFGPMMAQSPRALPQMLAALNLAIGDAVHIVVLGTAGSQDTQKMVETLSKPLVPDKVMALIIPEQTLKEGVLAFTENFKMIDGKATAYICVNQSCSLPTADPQTALALLLKAS